MSDLGPDVETFADFQDASATTSIYPKIQIVIDGGEPIDAPWIYCILGLMGESGELAEKLKKMIRDEKGVMSPERRELVRQELGDILWYSARLTEAFGTTLRKVAENNIRKLFSRKARGVLGGSGDTR